MPITGVFFIPSHPNSTTALTTITNRLRTAFPSADLIPLSRWALEHKLMRDTPGLLPQSSAQPPTKPRYMQFLSLSHHPTHGFIYTSEPTEKPFHPPNASPAPSAGLNPSPAGAAGSGTRSGSPVSGSTPISNTTQTANMQSTAAVDLSPMIMTTVSPSSFGTLFHHFTYACQPFWCHRLTVAVPNGVVYELGDFRVRVGDVRQTFPTGRVRGTVVEIEWRGSSIVDCISPAPVGRGLSGTDISGGIGVEGEEADEDSGIDVSFSAIEEEDVDAEYAATALLMREFWNRFGVDGAREAILVPGIGKEVKEKLLRSKTGSGQKKERASRDEIGLGLDASGLEEESDPMAGSDLARQYMEVFRFNR